MQRAGLHRTGWLNLAAGFVVAYLALEWATYRADVSPLGITPWNPSAGLSLALLLCKGVLWAPALAVALLLSDVLVRHVPFPWWVELAEIGLTVGSYVAAAALLRRTRIGFDRSLATLRDLLLLVSVAVAAAMLVAVSYVALLWLSGLLAAHGLLSSVMRHWVGDTIGIMAVTPFLLLMIEAPARMALRGPAEAVLQALAILAAVELLLGDANGLREQLYYMLFLPVVWVAVRRGLPGAAAALCLMQVGLMAALHLRAPAIGDVAALQAVLAILLFAGLAIGVLVSERERAEDSLRRQDATLARVARAAGMSSLSSSIAHEISQPLTAIGNFTRTALRALEAEPPSLVQARVATAKAAAQLERAADIVGKLRRLFERGEVDLGRHEVATLLAEGRALVAQEAATHGVAVEAGTLDDGLTIFADRTQIVLVLVNLLRNGIEAASCAPAGRRRVVVRVVPDDADRVSIEVVDSGPGFPPGFDLDTHGPGQSDKPHGLGVGLGLCRSIVEAHGGRLSVLPRTAGAAVAFTIRRATGGRNAQTA
jgi:C4-dicarboxylate-specific signal transduction histidine kinase